MRASRSDKFPDLLYRPSFFVQQKFLLLPAGRYGIIHQLLTELDVDGLLKFLATRRGQKGTHVTWAVVQDSSFTTV